MIFPLVGMDVRMVELTLRTEKRKPMAHGKELFENLARLKDQTNDKLSSFANQAVYVQISSMPLGHNIIGQAQA